MISTQFSLFSRNMLWMFLLLLLFSQQPAHGQSAIPPDIKLMQLSHKDVRVIYEEGMDSTAFRIANAIAYLRHNRMATLPQSKMKDIDILLHNHTTIPNAFVALAPFRSEFFGTPLQNSAELGGTASWIDLLSIHEYRHVQQFYHSKVGFTKFLAFTFGDVGWGVGSNLMLPNWYWEGDAVVYETALTNSGRGRAPYFFREYKALFTNSIRVTYDQARFGSFVHPSPNHYQLGYLMQMHGRNISDNNLWNRVAEKSARWKPVVMSTSRNLKSETGLTTKKMFAEIKDSTLKSWKADMQSDSDTEFSTVSPKLGKRELAGYGFPHFTANENILAIKSTSHTTPTLVQITKDGSEQVLTSLGITTNEFLFYNGSDVYWTEVSLDPRWEYRNYSDIFHFDISTGTKQQITQKQKYFSPSLSNAKDRLAVVSYQPDLRPSLYVLDTNGQEVQQKKEFALDANISFPVWLAKDSALVFVKTYQEKSGLYVWNLKTDKIHSLFPSVNHIITFPKVIDNYVYFASTFSGTDDIYRIALNNPTEAERIIHSFLGAYAFDVDHSANEIVYATYTHRGTVLATSKISVEKTFVTADQSLIEHFPELSGTVAFEGGTFLNQLPSIADSTTIKPFDKKTELINTHSWAPNLADPIVAFSGYSTNLTGTLNLTASALYNINENAVGAHLLAEYSGFYPVVYLEAGLWDGRSTDNNGVLGTLSGFPLDGSTSNEHRVALGLGLPLTTVKGNFLRTFSIRSDLGFLRYFINESIGVRIQEGDFSYSSTSLFFENRKRQASQQIYSPFSQQLSVTFRTPAFVDDRNVSSQFLSRANFTFPGFHPTNNTIFSAGYSRRQLNSFFFFTDEFLYPRGYVVSELPAFESFTFSSLGYAFPLLYPHDNFLGLAYINRIRAQVFADVGFTQKSVMVERDANLLPTFTLEDQTYRSLSAELIFDGTFARIIPINLTLRASHLFDAHGKNAAGIQTFQVTVANRF